MSDSRRAAAEILRQIITDRIFYSECRPLLDSLSAEDRAFVNMLALTSLRRLVFIRKILKTYIKKKIPAKFALAEFALINAVSELLFMNTPDYAVLNSYVNLIKKQSDRFLAGMANAVLRRIAAAKTDLLSHAGEQIFPDAFRKILAEDYTPAQIKSFAQIALQTPPLDITVKTDPSGWAQKLGAEILPGGSLRLHNAGNIPALPGYADGQWWIQDCAAALPVKLLGDIKGQKVLDLCAAPGGKTAQLINAGAAVTAVDISAARLDTLRRNLERLNLSAEIICADALDFLQNPPQQYDIILLDAPCSATGTFRRHPELVHAKGPDDVAKMCLLQQQLLDAAVPTLKKNGILLYCTCSIARREGEQQIAGFLKRQTDCRIIPLKGDALDALKAGITPEGFLRILPDTLADRGGTDAFFAALIEKVK